jgi:hypothetical protein
MKKFLSVVFVIICVVFHVAAQVDEEVPVPIITESGRLLNRCRAAEDGIIDKKAWRKILADKDCSYLAKTLSVDFEKQTLITYRIHGDCFVMGDAAVFRVDREKIFRVKVRNIWGGCRAAGSFQGWLVIDKIPPDYKLEFKQIIADGTLPAAGELFPFPKTSPQPLETRAFEMKGCIQTIYTQQFVIKDNEAFLKTIRSDASRDFCLKNLEKIDFAKHTLLGIEINSGYCRTPVGLEHKAVKDETKKQYVVEISYIDPRGSTCRALSEYDLWLLVPKLPEGFVVKFEVKSAGKVMKEILDKL